MGVAYPKFSPRSDLLKHLRPKTQNVLVPPLLIMYIHENHDYTCIYMRIMPHRLKNLQQVHIYVNVYSQVACISEYITIAVHAGGGTPPVLGGCIVIVWFGYNMS
jgi:hypothetical protein